MDVLWTEFGYHRGRSSDEQKDVHWTSQSDVQRLPFEPHFAIWDALAFVVENGQEICMKAEWE